MRHFLYAVSQSDRAPVGDGDAASWLIFYKLGSDVETFIPMPEGLEEIQPGDMLWFAANTTLQGAAKVTRLEDDQINGRKEIWFEQPRLAEEKVETHLKTAPIRQETAERWVKALSEVR